MSLETDIVIIGAGVVGLAIAAELAHPDRHIFVIEKNRTFGLETSSHNSEVIHAGFYYPSNTLKTRFCVEGNALLYKICEKYQINYKRLTKIIVAADTAETLELEKLQRQGEENGLKGLQLLSRMEVKHMEPNVRAVAGLFSPSTGIIDSWGLMRSFYGRAFENGASFVFNSEVNGIEKISGGYKIYVADKNGIASLSTQVVINCAGLFCDKVAALAGIDIAHHHYRIFYCRGSYFNLNPRAGRLVNRLVYPVPEQAGKGIHITLNLDGQMKLGPNVKYMDTIDYSVDENDRAQFYEAAHRYLPQIEFDDLSPDSSGVRPKLQGLGENFRDFVIQDESINGLPGFINLMGIESPGLTSSPAIAKYVSDLVKIYVS